MLLSEAVEPFLRYLRVRKNRSGTTIDTYGCILENFTSVVGKKEVGALTVKDIDDYADILDVRNLSPKTIRCKLNAIRSFVRYLYIKDLSTIKPEQVDIPSEDSQNEANFLTLEEAQSLVSVIQNVRDRALILFMLSTWVRVSELCNIELSHIYKRTVFVKKGKGGKPRPVFVSKEAEKALQAYIHAERGTEEGPLFPNPTGGKMSRQRINKIVERYATLAGLKKVTPHTLRHTGASQFIDVGGSLEEAQKILGHSKITTTMVYVHFRNEKLHNSFDETSGKFSFTEALAETH